MVLNKLIVYLIFKLGIYRGSSNCRISFPQKSLKGINNRKVNCKC